MENTNLENEKRIMKWQHDFENYFDVYTTFILDGFIDDIHPIIDPSTDEVDYVPLTDYLIAKYSEQRTEDKKCIIVYDPTESCDKRFHIASEYRIEEVQPEDGEGEPTQERRYDDRLAQHFWDILHTDALEQQMIEHNAGGVSLDLARIHYAISENGRMREDEILSAFRDFWESLTTDANNSTGYVFVIKMTSRLLTRSATGNNGIGQNELQLFRQLLIISRWIANNPQHKLVVLANEVTDLPMWFTNEIANPFVKCITLEKPTKPNIEAFFDKLINEYTFGDEFTERYHAEVATNPDYEENIKRKFCAYTNDFTMREFCYLQRYLELGNVVDHPDKLRFLVSKFKAGEIKNPWDDEQTVKKILQVSRDVSEVIKGQEYALESVQKILTRAAIGLGRGANPNAPRVVLFLAGPTGTGKTEICKQLSKAIFGSEDRIVRFDMSEYRQEHADQKLFGAPPGYVGYEAGGKLTNALKKEPFSLILFDEIEKAHPSILDKFLQILGDGRLTDGKGETVSFSDAIIAITSNAGVTSPTPENEAQAQEILKVMGGEAQPEVEVNMHEIIAMEENNLSRKEIYDALKEYFRYNVKYYFCGKLGRPELYGRIEDAIVYYNYIGKDAVESIVKNQMKKTIKEAKDIYRLVDVEYSDAVKDEIVNFCQGEHVRANGARGIIKTVDKIFESSLSGFLSPYRTMEDNHNVEELRGQTLTCELALNDDGEFTDNDIVWRIK